MVNLQDKSPEGVSMEHEYKYTISEEIFQILTNTKFEDILLGNDLRLEFKENRKKNRPYIYFDTEDCKLLSLGGQISIRKREKDFFLTFKTGNLEPLSTYLTARKEDNQAISNQQGEDIFRQKKLSSIESIDTIKNVLAFGQIPDASQLRELCSFTVESYRNYGVLNANKQELVELSIDKILINDSKAIYEIELEFKYINNNSINLPALEKLNDLVIGMLDQIIEKKSGKNPNLSDSKIAFPKYRRVLEMVRLSNKPVEHSDKLIDWTDGSNQMNRFIDATLNKTGKPFYLIPLLLSTKPHPDYKLDYISDSDVANIEKLRDRDTNKYYSAMNELYYKARKEINKYSSEYIRIALNELKQDQDGFHFYKMALPELEYLLVFIFSNETKNPNESISIFKKIENFIDTHFIEQMIQISGEKDLYNKLQLNFGLGNKDAAIEAKGMSRIISDIAFFDFYPGKEDLNKLNCDKAISRSRLNLEYLISNRSQISKFEGKGPCCTLRGQKTRNKPGQILTYLLRKSGRSE